MLLQQQRETRFNIYHWSQVGLIGLVGKKV